MGFSRQEYPYTGGTQDFAVNFPLGYLEEADIEVYVNGETDGFGEQVFRAYTFIDEGTIRVTDPIPNPSTVVVQRTVSKDQLEIDLESEGPVTRVTLTRAFQQLMMNIHELLDGRTDSFQGADIDAFTALRDQALASKDDAEAAELLAEASAQAAALSAAAAASSEAGVDADRVAAEIAATSAINASVASAQSEAVAEGHKDQSETNAVAAAAAKVAADIARDAAIAAQTAAEVAEASAEADKDLAEAAAALIGGMVIPVGAVIAFPFNTAPLGWLPADGRVIDDTYPELKAALVAEGFPVNGSGHPSCPDYRGLFLRGWDAGRGLDPGRTNNGFQSFDVQAHTHAAGTLNTVAAGAHTHPVNGTFGTVGTGNGVNVADGQNNEVPTNRLSTSSAGSHTHAMAGATASAGGAETRPMNQSVLYCIKAYDAIQPVNTKVVGYATQAEAEIGTEESKLMTPKLVADAIAALAPTGGGGGGGFTTGSQVAAALDAYFGNTDWRDVNTGPAGEDGIDGTNGTNGTNGVDGIDGQDGQSVTAVTLTQAAYDALTPDPNTLYLITG